jgi:hypothetical protein
MGFPVEGDSAFPQIGISNSEATSSCERAWLYGYHPEAKLAPKSYGVALTRGLTGHKVLEDFYGAIRDGDEYDHAVAFAMENFEKVRVDAFMEADGWKLEMLNYLKTILEAYFKHYRADIENWEILDVEEFRLLQWDGEKRVYLPMRLDMVIYQKSGKFAGEISPVDHKFVNDFWNDWKMRLNSQLPLQILTLRDSKFKGKLAPVVKRGIVNQIRTRVLKDPFPAELFRRSFVEPKRAAIEKVFQNHLKKALRQERLKRMPLAQAYEETTAEWGGPNCQFCHFKSICAVDLEGGNVATTIAAEFTKSTYGYPPFEELTGNE